MNMTTVPSDKLKAMQQEIELLKEQLKQIRIEADFNFEQYQDAGRLMFELKAVTEQQAAAIRVKNAALSLAMIGLDESWEELNEDRVEGMRKALAIQPSPEILQARDGRVAVACARLINRFISGDGILNDTWIHEIEDAIRSG